MSAAEGKRLLRLTAATLVAAALLPAGCNALSSLTGKLPGPVGQNARDNVLRDRVEADAFPNAKQVGL